MSKQTDLINIPDAITVDGSNNVGIGTSSPTAYTGYSTIGLNGTNGGILEFKKGDTQMSRISNAGDLAIQFATNNTERLRIDSDGLKFNGDTAAANALSDYEEGTWTPAFPNGGTVGTVNSATYTKVGQLVFAGFYISTLSGIPSTSTAFVIGGLPFNVTSGSGYQAGGGVSYVNGANWASTGAMNTPLAQVNTANFYFHRDDNNPNTVKSSQATVLNGQEMICSIIYQTSA